MDRVFTLRNVPVYNGYTNDRLDDGIYFTYNTSKNRLTVNGQFDVDDVMFTNMATGTVTHQFPKEHFFYNTLRVQLANAHEQLIVRWLKATPERYAAFIIEYAPHFVVTLSHSMVSTSALQMARKSVQ
jgi:hypothetical protein